MKKFFFIMIMLITLSLLEDESKAVSKRAPERFLIIGGAVVGAELVYSVINLFKGKETEEEQNLESKSTNIIDYQKEKIDREKELAKLLAPSKLFEVMAQTNVRESTNEVTQTNIELPKIKDEAITGSAVTNIVTNKLISRVTNIESVSNFGIPPEGIIQTSIIKVTNYSQKEVYEYRKGVIDYYEVGKAYFRVGKRVKAKEYLLKTIALNINKEEAISFLMENYEMSLKNIMQESRKYKK
ncbi:MAG: hypothetical protein KKH98_03270 [Spirochaetes bacterium]|nr:hypothetical protein [Spirochaetota bacterium]